MLSPWSKIVVCGLKNMKGKVGGVRFACWTAVISSLKFAAGWLISVLLCFI